MKEEDKKFAKAVDLPICPFCDGKVYYTAWITHKIYQMECENCKSHWRTGITDPTKRDIYVQLTRYKNNDRYNEYLNQKLSLKFWQDMIRKRIKI